MTPGRPVTFLLAQGDPTSGDPIGPGGEFMQAQKMEAMGRLAAGVAHDFNNILSIVLSYAAFVLESLEPGHPARRDVEEIKKAGERGAAFVRQLMAFGRKQPTEPRETDVNEALASTAMMLRRLLGEQISLDLRLDPDAGRIFVDPTQLVQVIINLAVNARDAMGGGGTLSMVTSCAAPTGACGDELVCITVADTGTGIPGAILPRIFEPFFTTKEKGRGTGLGLAMVYGSVIQNGGRIEVESEPGRGTVFSLYFSRVSSLRADGGGAEGGDLRGRGEKILVVEDEPGVRSVIRRLLSSAGYDVIEAGNGEEAIEKFDGEVRLVISDVIMPGMGGAQLAGNLSRIRPGIKIVYTSGYPDEMLVTQGTIPAGSRMIGKPIEKSALLLTVREVLEGK